MVTIQCSTPFRLRRNGAIYFGDREREGICFSLVFISVLQERGSLYVCVDGILYALAGRVLVGERGDITYLNCSPVVDSVDRIKRFNVLVLDSLFLPAALRVFSCFAF